MTKDLSKTAATADSDRHFRTDHLKANLKNRTVRGGAITVTTQVSRIVLQTGSTVVLARLLTPEDYGLIGMVKAVTGLISLFKDLGLSMATVQKAEINHRQVSTLFWLNIAFSLALVVITAALAPVVAGFYGESRLTGIMLILATGYLFSGTGVQHQALLSRQMRYLAIAIIDVISLVSAITVAIVAASLGAQYWSLVLMSLTQAAVNTTGYWLTSGWSPGLPRWDSEVRSMVTFGGGLTGSTIVTYLMRNLDNVLIGWYWGAKELGLYTRAYQLLILPLISVNSPIRAVSINTLSRLLDSPVRYRSAYLRILEKIIIVTMPGVVFLMATSDWLVLLLLGPRWSDVNEIFGWLSLVALTLPTAYTTGWLFISQGRTWEMFRMWTIAGAVTVAAFAVGLPWGATGVAAAYSISGLLICTPLRFWYVGRKGPVKTKDLYTTMAPSLCASLAALVVLLAFRQWVDIANPVIGLVIAGVITLAVSLGTLALIPAGRKSLQDYLNLLLLLKKKPAK